MNNDKIRRFADITVVGIGGALLLYFFGKYVFFAVLPFLLSWGVAFSVRPLAVKLSSGTKIPVKIISLILTVIIVLGGISLLLGILFFTAREAWGFLTNPSNTEAIYNFFVKIFNIGGILGDREGSAELEAEIGEAVKSALGAVISKLVAFLTGVAEALPKVLLFILVTVVSSIYFSFELDGVNSFVKKRLPKRIFSALVNFKDKFLKTLLKYLRSYLILMLVTFIIMLFGFLVLGVRYSVLFAFVVAFLDALPLIGVGTVLIPWSLYEMFFGSFSLGVGLVVLFFANLLIRQLIEPKIVGKSLGIHPILSLILLYAGYSFFGFFGLLLIPFLSVALNIILKRDEFNR